MRAARRPLVPRLPPRALAGGSLPPAHFTGLSMANFNGFDAHRFLRARIMGAQRPRKNWIGRMFPDLTVPPVALIVPPIPEKQKPQEGGS